MEKYIIQMIHLPTNKFNNYQAKLWLFDNNYRFDNIKSDKRFHRAQQTRKIFKPIKQEKIIYPDTNIELLLQYY